MTAIVPSDDRERQALNRVWRAFGCASNPEDFKASVRDVMWGQVEEFALEATSEDNRLARENRELESALASERAKTARFNAPETGDDWAVLESVARQAERRALAAEAAIAQALAKNREIDVYQYESVSASTGDVTRILAAAPTAAFDAALAEAQAGALEEIAAYLETFLTGFTSETPQARAGRDIIYVIRDRAAEIREAQK